MINNFVTLLVPSQAVNVLSIAGLLILLIASQLMDYEGSPIRSKVPLIRAFTTPLIALFAIVVIVRIIQIIAG